VAHGASQLFLEVFGPEIGSHARTAIGVKSLPLNSPVEVDAIFQR
jgi:enamine deaminase RidA (YjgF/YER057c/UK114 family)